MVVNDRDSASRMRFTSLVKREMKVPVAEPCTIARSACMSRANIAFCKFAITRSDTDWFSTDWP